MIEDLIGSIVYDESGQLVGQIMGVTDYGFDDIIIIKEDNCLYEVPFRKAIFTNIGETVTVLRAEYDGSKVVQQWK